jgi:pimeloyl-ACP methyl ester carboxylesterase
MQYTAPKDDFRLAYDRAGSGPAAVLLHGWPGDRTDYDQLVPLLTPHADVVVPDLRGFGQSDKHLVNLVKAYSPVGQAEAIIAFLDELKIKNAVLAGYDVGSLIAQFVAARRPDLVKALVVSPPLPGAGTRVLELTPVKEFWYTTFHQQQLSLDVIDGNRAAVRAYLRHFWEHWSGPNYVVDEKRIDHLADVYS